MIKVSNELDFKNWFTRNYRKLGFSEIIRKDIGIFPDFIMLKDNKEVKLGSRKKELIYGFLNRND